MGTSEQRSFELPEEFAPRVLALAEEIAAIPAPTGDEKLRTTFVRDRMATLGYDAVDVDALGNVVGRLQGLTAEPRLLIAAHLDTVFPMSTRLSVRNDKKRSYGPQ